jgi:hypothetical protein
MKDASKPDLSAAYPTSGLTSITIDCYSALLIFCKSAPPLVSIFVEIFGGRDLVWIMTCR